MSTRLVFGVVGAAVGTFFGSPQLGWAIGSAIGGAIDPQTIKGPSIGDIADQTSSEGGPRPIFFAVSKPVAGNIIAQGPPRIVKKKKRQGKGGPKVETESVFRTYAVGVGEGPGSFAQIWRNGQLVYDALQGLVSEEDNINFLEHARFFSGDFEQNPSPDLETIFGVGTTPAHRGTIYMVMADEDLTDLRGAIPQWTFRVQRCATRTELLLTANTGELVEHVSPSTSVITVFENHTTPPASGISNLQAKFPVASFRNVNHGGSVNQVNWIDVLDSENVDRFIFPGTFTFEGWFFRVSDAGQDPQTLLVPNLSGPALGWYFMGVRASGVGGQLQFDVGPGGDGGQFAGAVMGTGVWNHVAVTRDEAGVIRGFIDGVKSSNEYSYVGDVGARGVDDITHVGVLRGFSVASGDFDGYIDQIRMTHSCLYTNDFTPPAAPFSLATSSGTCTELVSDIVTEICERARLPASLIDVSDLAALVCRGLTVTNAYPAFAALRSLSEVFFFDCVPQDGKVHFVRRGANHVATITEDDLLDDEEDIEQSRRPDSISIPRVLNLSYHDIAGGIAPDKQTSERAADDRRASGEVSLQTAVLLSSDEAAQVVAVNHKVMIEDQRGELKFQLSDEFIALTSADPVIIQWQGRSVRARLQKVDTDDGLQQYIAAYDRQSAYTSEVEGIPAAPQTPPPSNIVGPTLIQPLDIHILQDADDNAGLVYYLAVSGVFEAWQGATIELSFDAGANYVDSGDVTTSAIMGELLTALPDHPYPYPDEVHTVRVRIDTPAEDLEAATFAALLSRDTNLAIIGDELVQFGTVDEAYEGVWDLSFFLRGRKGSTTSHHVIGERFVLLDRGALAMIAAEMGELGQTLTFRATSFGAAVTTGTVVTMVYAGRSQIERAPAYLAARREGSDAVVSWQGVGRLGSGISVAQGARFAGYRVTFDDGTLEESIDTNAQELTHDVTAFASPLTIRVAQLNDLTGAGPEVEVVLI